MTRRAVVSLLVLSVLLACGSTARADDEPRRITVNGHAELRVVPDEVIVTLGVETFDVDLTKAKSNNDARVIDIIAAAEALGVPRERIGTEFIQIEPEYRTEDWLRHFVHYRVRKTMVIRLGEIGKFEELLAAALEAGANYVHGVDFRTTALRKHRDRARALAIAAGREKAEALAKELGESVGRVHTIQEGYAPWWSTYGWWGGSRRGGMSQNVLQNVGGPSEGVDGPTTPGQIGIDARVTVTFELD